MYWKKIAASRLPVHQPVKLSKTSIEGSESNLYPSLPTWKNIPDQQESNQIVGNRLDYFFNVQYEKGSKKSIQTNCQTPQRSTKGVQTEMSAKGSHVQCYTNCDSRQLICPSCLHSYKTQKETSKVSRVTLFSQKPTEPISISLISGQRTSRRRIFSQSSEVKRESSKRKCFRTEQLFDTLKMRTSKQKDNECKLSTVRLFNKLITSENEKRMYYYRRNQKNRTNVSVLIEAGQYKQTFNPSFFVTFSEQNPFALA